MSMPSRAKARSQRPKSGQNGSLRPPFLRVFALLFALVLGCGAITGPMLPAAYAAEATKETLNQLSSAEKKLDQVEKQLDEISKQYTQLAKEQATTLKDIEDVQNTISGVEAEIETRYEELKAKQATLADRVATNYKTGTTRSLIQLVLSSSSFEELTSNIYYANKITQNDVALISDVREVKQQLETDRRELKEHESELESLRDEQQERLNEMQAKQKEAEDTVANLSQEVKDLMAKRDAEIAEAAAAEARQREEAARQAQGQKGGSSSQGSTWSGGGGSSSSGGDYSYSGTTNNNASGKGAAIVAAAHSVPSPGSGLCAMWVSQVYQRALGYYPGGNANDMYARCTSSNLDDLEPGMIVAVSTHPHTTAGSIWGHVGIYMGDGVVMDNIGYIHTTDLNSWISFYDDTVPVRWGWL